MTLKYVASYLKINEPERVKVISEFKILFYRSYMILRRQTLCVVCPTQDFASWEIFQHVMASLILQVGR